MPIKVLVVDDEADLEVLVTQRFRKQIQSGQLQFVFARDGAAALAQLAAMPDIYVVLSDIKMPHMDGLTLLSELTEHYPLVRMIIITAYGDMRNIRTAMNRGAYDFLLKPLNFQDLEVTLNRAITHVQHVIDERASRQEVENQLLQLKKAVENMQIGVTVVDLNGQIRYCNFAEARMHGYAQGEMLGRNVGSLAPPELRKPMKLEEIRRWKGLIRESVNIRKDGSRFPVWLMSEIVKDANGEPTAIVTSCEDITERKKAQEELERHRKNLEGLVRERTTELTTANEQLQQEIRERTRVETELRTTYQNLKQLNDRLQAELSLARKIQQSLLPPPDPRWNEADVVCYNRPAYEVGGDFYAYHAFEAGHPLVCSPDMSDRGQYVLAIGDVSGKGMPAALLMAVSLASFQENLGRRLEPAVLFKHLDQTIMPYTQTTIQNCALLYLEINVPRDSRPGIARIVNAGCITPIVRRMDGTVEWIDVRGMPLGSGWGLSLGYEETTVTLQQGDMIILTSDGVIEARNTENELLGFDRFEEIVLAGPHTSATDMMTHLQSEMATFVGTAELYDDLTMVVVRV